MYVHAASLIQNWEYLNERNQEQVQTCISLLLRQQNESTERKNPPRGLGIPAHRFHHIAGDFNDPLPKSKECLG